MPAGGGAAAAGRRTFLLEVSPYDPVTGAEIPVYATTAEEWNTSSGDTPASTSYWPGLAISGLGASLLNGGMFGGVLQAEAGEISLPNTIGQFDTLLRSTWIGRTLTIWKVEPGAAHSSRTVYRKGYVSAATFGVREIRLALESFNATLFERELQAKKFWGRPRALHFEPSGILAPNVSLGDNCDMTGSFSIEVLYRITGTPGSNNAPVVSKDTGAAGFGVWQQTSGVLRFFIRGGHGFNTIPLNDGALHFCSFVYDTAANTAYIYVDGVLVNSVASTVDPTATAAVLRFCGDGGITNVCHGDLAEVRIWNRALSEIEINRWLYGGVAKGESGLVGHWKMSNGSGSTLSDDSYNGVNGTISNATWIGTYEGDEQLGGVEKPWATGTVYHVDPVLIDAQKLIYAVNARGNDANVVPNVWVQGQAVPCQGAAVFDIWGTSVTPGQFKYDPARGLIRLGSTPTGRLSVTFRALGYGGFDSRYPPGSLKAIVEQSAGFSSSAFSVADSDFSGFFAPVGEVSFVDSSGGTVAAGTANIVATKPTGAATGDLMVMFVGTHSTGGAPYVDFTIATPTGWTPIVNVAAVPAGVAARRAYAFYRTVQVGDTSWTFGGIGTSCNRCWHIEAWRGHDGATLFPSGYFGSQKSDSTVATATAPSLTTGRDGEHYIAAWVATTVDVPDIPGGMVDRANLKQTGGNVCALRVASEHRPISGATGSRSVSMSPNATYAAVCVLISVALTGTPILSAGHGLYVQRGGIKCSEAIERVLQSYRAFGGFGEDGVFRAKDLTRDTLTGTPVQAFTEDDVRDVVVEALLPPVKEIRSGYRPYWPALSVSDIAAGVSASESWDLQQEYRPQRFQRWTDRYGRSIAEYGDDAKRIDLQHLLVDAWAGARVAQAVFDAHDAFIPVWGFVLPDFSRFVKVGDVVTLNFPRLGLGATVSCLVVRTSVQIAAGRQLQAVSVVDATTLVS